MCALQRMSVERWAWWVHFWWTENQLLLEKISNAIFFYSFKTNERNFSHDGTLKLDELHGSQTYSHQNDGIKIKLDSRGKYILLYIVIERLLANSVEWLNHWIENQFYSIDFEMLILWFRLWFNQIKSNPIKYHLAMEWISGSCNLLSIAVRNSQCNQLNLLDDKHFAEMNMCFKFNFLNCR